jgi:Protein of unknown function (DUF3489)
VLADVAFEDGVQPVGIHLELGRDHRRHPRRPVDPGIALVPGQPKNLRHCLRPVDELPLHLLQAQTALLSLQNLVRGPGLHEGHRLIELLKRTEGATVEQIAAATGWQHHTIRGAISGALKKKLGLTVEETRTREVGPNNTGAKGSSTIYRIVEPA